jgi:hypothetical protein
MTRHQPPKRSGRKTKLDQSKIKNQKSPVGADSLTAVECSDFSRLAQSIHINPFSFCMGEGY